MRKRRFSTAVGTVVVGMACAAATASASGFDLTGGTFTGTATAQQTVVIDGSYSVTCDVALQGDTEGVAGNAAAATVDPTFTNCDYFGWPVDVTVHGSWELEVTAKLTTTPRVYQLALRMPAGASMTWAIPLSGCEWNVSAPQTVTSGVVGAQAVAGLDLEMDMYGLAFTTNGNCPFGNGNTLEYHSNGPIQLEDVAVDEL